MKRPPEIDADLVAGLIAAQFPQWSDLPIRAIEPGGWDNRSFRLGHDKLVRLPSAEGYSLQVEKEQHWLPILAPALPVAIPRPLAIGRPTETYPWPWSIYAWIPGETATANQAHEGIQLARALAGFLTALHRIDPAGGPQPGRHNCYRGAPLDHYDAEVREAVAILGEAVEPARVLRTWEQAVGSSWPRAPVWLHGDLALDNLLLREGRLAAVIDFGCCGIGDPACDLAIAWAGFDESARAAFMDALPLDPETWERGRGWALWKALVTLRSKGGEQAARARRTLEQIFA